MKSKLDEFIGIRGLSDMTIGDLCQGASLHEAVLRKCDQLDRKQWSDQMLEQSARLMVELVRDSLCGSYNDLSLLAFAHILVGLDYFIKQHDRIPDTEIGGFHDDNQELTRVVAHFESEIDAYKQWKLRNEAMV